MFSVMWSERVTRIRIFFYNVVSNMQEAYSVERRGMILDYITVKWKLDNAQRDYWVVNFRRSLIIARL